MATKKVVKEETKKQPEAKRDGSKDNELLLACILREMETLNREIKDLKHYAALISKLKVLEHGGEA